MNNRQNYEEKLEALLRLLEEMQKDQAYLMQALGNLEKIPSGSIPGDIAGQAKAAAVGKLVKSREKTNQELLKIYRRMYEDLRNDFASQLETQENTAGADAD